jgi:hypothetical protein
VTRGQVDDPNLSLKIGEVMDRLKTENAENLSVADRLTLRAGNQRITIPFDDQDEPFSIEFRVPVTSEFDRFLQLKQDLLVHARKGNKKGQESVTDALYKLLAGLSVDPSLDYAFFKSGLFVVSDFLYILESLEDETLRRVSQAQSFREKRRRDSVISNMSRNGEVSP